jgi:hypothetical protein
MALMVSLLFVVNSYRQGITAMPRSLDHHCGEPLLEW